MAHFLDAVSAIQAGQTSLHVRDNLDDRESAVFAGLVQDSTLESLELWSINTEAIVTILTWNTTLKKLSFSPTDPNSGLKILQAFAKNTTLTSLVLYRANFSECAGLLANILKENTTLLSLELCNNNLTAEECRVIAGALEENTTLKTFTYSNDVDEPAAAALARMLYKNNTLSTLAMTGCKLFDDVCAELLVKALETNRTLTSLGLRCNNLGLSTCTALHTVLKMNPSLTSLDLTHNEIGDIGGLTIFKALEAGSTLRELRMENTGLGPACAIAVPMFLQHNSTLRTLELKRNPLSNTICTDLAKTLETNTTLTSLSIDLDDHAPPRPSIFHNRLRLISTSRERNVEPHKILRLLGRNRSLPYLYQLISVAISLGLNPFIVKNYVNESVIGTAFLNDVLEQASARVSDRLRLDKDSASVMFKYL